MRPSHTYDDSAWTMGMANNIEVKTIEDKTILDAPATLLKEDVTTLGVLLDPNGSIGATNAVYLVRHNGSLNLITLRYRLKDVADQGGAGVVQVRRPRVPRRLADHPGVRPRAQRDRGAGPVGPRRAVAAPPT